MFPWDVVVSISRILIICQIFRYDYVIRSMSTSNSSLQLPWNVSHRSSVMIQFQWKILAWISQELFLTPGYFFQVSLHKCECHSFNNQLSGCKVLVCPRVSNRAQGAQKTFLIGNGALCCVWQLFLILFFIARKTRQTCWDRIWQVSV